MGAYKIEGEGNGRGIEDKREWLNKQQIRAGIIILVVQMNKLIIRLLMCHHDSNYSLTERSADLLIPHLSPGPLSV